MFCKLWGLKGVRVCYVVQEVNLLTGWQGQILRHEISCYVQLASLSSLSATCWRDAYCCVRPSDQQIPSWSLLLCPALWSAHTVMTRKLLCPALWPADSVVTRKLFCPVRWSDSVMTRKLLCPVRWSADTAVTPTAVSGPLISIYRRDAYCCVRPAYHQIPSWRVLLCPALWSPDTVVTHIVLSCPLISRYPRDAYCYVRLSDHQIPSWRVSFSIRSTDQQFPLRLCSVPNALWLWGLVTQSDVVILVQESDESLLNGQICGYICSYFLFSDCCVFLPSAIKLQAERASALVWNLCDTMKTVLTVARNEWLRQIWTGKSKHKWET